MGKGREDRTGQKKEKKPYAYRTRIGRYVHYLNMRIKRNEKAFRIYTVLRILVILTLIRCVLEGNYESAMLCVLSLFCSSLRRRSSVRSTGSTQGSPGGIPCCTR